MKGDAAAEKLIVVTYKIDTISINPENSNYNKTTQIHFQPKTDPPLEET